MKEKYPQTIAGSVEKLWITLWIMCIKAVSVENVGEKIFFPQIFAQEKDLSGPGFRPLSTFFTALTITVTNQNI